MVHYKISKLDDSNANTGLCHVRVYEYNTVKDINFMQFQIK